MYEFVCSGLVANLDSETRTQAKARHILTHLADLDASGTDARPSLANDHDSILARALLKCPFSQPDNLFNALPPNRMNCPPLAFHTTGHEYV
jgi:hypothetical protein